MVVFRQRVSDDDDDDGRTGDRPGWYL